MNVEGFAIGSVMIHDVPRGGHDVSEMTLTDAPIQLDDQLRGYFHSKIINSLNARGVDVVIDAGQDGSVRDAVTRIIGDQTRLAADSRAMAERLHAVQTGVNPPGLLTVISGVLANAPVVAVLKLEREQGIRFKVRRSHGHAVVDLQFLRDLTLTNKTKVFKTALFAVDGHGSHRTLVGRVSDDQRGTDAARGVAEFFLSTYLGCQLRISPARATLEFVQAAESYINGQVPSPEKRGRYQVALLAAMQDQRLDVTPRTFAATHLEPADRRGFLDEVAATGLDPNAAFQKDLSLVKVSGFRMTFENGMVLVGQSDDLRERVRIRPDDEEAGVEINDAVQQLRGR
ncbi:MAG TPA: nucleoid-associated protein [Mycobacteriales bacterium]|nr:nucleoid-associated protein [Mycobacteriales bacterium]